jgi:hypothetical protein
MQFLRKANARSRLKFRVCAQKAASLEGLREQNGSEDAPPQAETAAG